MALAQIKRCEACGFLDPANQKEFEEISNHHLMYCRCNNLVTLVLTKKVRNPTKEATE